MIFGAQIGLLVLGIVTLIRGQYGMGRGRKIIGPKARLLGGLCLVPLPVSFIFGFVVGFTNPQAVSTGELRGMISGVEIAILVCTITALIILAKKFFKEQESGETAASQ